MSISSNVYNKGGSFFQKMRENISVYVLRNAKYLKSGCSQWVVCAVGGYNQDQF